MTICSQCIMPGTYPGISFDAQGICNFCRDHQRVAPLGVENFLERTSHRRGKTYDCVLGISGGKDSCYVAYLARKLCNFRALAVFYDFPFLCDLARDNARRVCDALGIELRFVTSRNNLERDLLRNHLMSVAATGTTWGQCLFCHYGIDAVLHKIATEHEVPFILSGTTSNELWWDPGSRARMLLRQVSRLPVREWLRFGYYQFKAFRTLVDQRRQFPLSGNSPWSVYSHPKSPQTGPEVIRMFDYFPWDQQKIERVLIAEAGWVKPDKTLSWRYDCILEPLLDYTYLREFGVSTVGLYLSSLIRNQLIDRDEALRIQQQSDDAMILHDAAEKVFDLLNIPKPVRDAFYAAAPASGTCRACRSAPAPGSH